MVRVSAPEPSFVPEHGYDPLFFLFCFARTRCAHVSGPSITYVVKRRGIRRSLILQKVPCHRRIVDVGCLRNSREAGEKDRKTTGTHG